MNFKTIEDEALHLSPEDRAKLAQRLILSLDSLSDIEIEESWLVEAQRRAQELDRGDIRAIPEEEVRRKARALLR
jgi:putative addiction module component (TIGR02574 family)